MLFSQRKPLNFWMVLIKKLSWVARQPFRLLFQGVLGLPFLALLLAFQLFFFCCNLYCQYFTLSASPYYINLIGFKYNSQTPKQTMFRLCQEENTNCSVYEISKFNNFLQFYDGVQDMVEVDIKHRLLAKKKLKYPPLSVKCFNWQGRNQYFITKLDKIELKKGVVSQSNSKAEFTGLIDCLGEAMLFSKFHHNYKKHSINYLWEGSKRIVKLTDQPMKKLIFNPSNSQVIYSVKDIVSSFDLNEPEKDTLLFKKSTFLHDSNNLYYLRLDLENKSKGEYECGIYDFRNGKNTDTWISKEIPIKVESFARTMIVATNSAIQIFDIRKLIKPVERDAIEKVKDFLYEPNLNKLYVGCENKLKIYKVEY